MPPGERSSLPDASSSLGMTLLEEEKDLGDRTGCSCCQWWNRGCVRLFEGKGEVVVTPLQIAFSFFLISMSLYVVIDFLTAQDLLKLAELAMTWLEDTSFLAVMLVFVLFSTVWTTCMGLTSIVCIGIGFVLKARWSFWLALVVGSCVAFIGTSFGNLAAFLLGRTILYPCAHGLIARNRWMVGFDLAIFHHGIKMNVLLRLAPIIPFSILNYGMAVTSTTVDDFCIGFLGGLPYLIAFVYLGTLVSSASGIGDALTMSTKEWLLVCGVGIAVLVIFTWYMYIYTKEEMKGLMESAESIERGVLEGGNTGRLSRRGSFAEHKASRSRRGSRS